MWKFFMLLISLSGYCIAGPVGLKRNMPIVQQRNDVMPVDSITEVEPAVANVDPNEMMIMSTLSLPSNATSIRADIADGFSCENKIYGYYADVDNDCQIFHVCLPVTYADGKENTFRWSFICPEETIFSQDSFTCMRPDDMTISCEESYQYYELNRNFGLVESQSDKENNNEQTSETVSSNETILEVENGPEPIKPIVQEKVEEKVDVNPIGQPRPVKIQKPNRRKPGISFAIQKKPTATFPLRKMPHIQPQLPVQVTEDAKENAKPVEEEEIIPTVQKFSRRPVPVISNNFKDKPEGMIGTRIELFNQRRKRPTMFNKQPVETQQEKGEQIKIEVKPEQQSFSPTGSEMSNTNSETQMADSDIKASESKYVFVKSETENETPQTPAEPEKSEYPIKVLDAFEEIPAVISEVVEIPDAKKETENEETSPVEEVQDAEKSEIANESQTFQEIQAPEETQEAQAAEEEIKIQEKIEIAEKEIGEQEKINTDKEIKAPMESQPEEAEETQTIEGIQIADEPQVAEEIPKIEVAQNLRSSAEETQTAEETQAAEDTQAAEETQVAENNQIVEETQTDEDTQIVEETQAAEETANMETSAEEAQIVQEAQPHEEVQLAEEVPMIKEVQIAQTAEKAPIVEDVHIDEEVSTPEEAEKIEKTQSVEESQNSEQIQHNQIAEEMVENQSTEQNQKTGETISADESLVVEQPQSVGIITPMEDVQAFEETQTMEKIKPVHVNESDEKIKPSESNVVEEQLSAAEESESLKPENSAEPAIFEENSDEGDNLVPVQTIEEMESEKPDKAPETMQATEEMNHPDSTVQQMYEDISDNRQSIGGFKPVDPVMAHEAEQLIADFINTLRNHDFTNETPGTHVEQHTDEEPEQQSHEGIAEVEEDKKVEGHEVNKEAITETDKIETNNGKNKGVEDVEEETQDDAEKHNIGEIQNFKEVEDHKQETENVQTFDDHNEFKDFNALKTQSADNIEELRKSEETQPEAINVPQGVYQIPVQVITTPIEEVPQAQSQESEVVSVPMTSNSEDKLQKEIPAMVMGSYTPLSIDDIVELVKERLDHMPKNEMETPMQLEQVLGNAKEDKAPEEKVEEKQPPQYEAEQQQQQQPIVQPEEQEQENVQSEEEIIMPIYQRFVQPVKLEDGVQTEALEQFNNNEQTDVVESVTDVKEKSNRSYSSHNMLKNLDPRKRRFLFKTESS